MTPAVEPLTSTHEVDEFDCGKEPLNTWLKKYALSNQAGGSTRTFVVAAHSQEVAAYYALAASAVEPDEATDRVSKGQGKYPVPVFLLARLAVGLRNQGRGFGQALLKDALLRCAQASEFIGARAVLVHAMDDEARAFYQHFDFEPSLTDPLHLFLLMKDVKALLRDEARPS